MTQSPFQWNPGGEKFRDRVSNTRVFRVYMLAKAPVLGVTGAYLDRVDLEACEMVLPFGRTTRNLFGDLFTSAAIAAAEMTSAASLVLHVRNQGAPLTAQLVALSCQQDRVVREQLRAVCPDGDRYADFVGRASKDPGLEETFPVTLVDSAGLETHEIEIRWRLVRKGRA